MPHSKMLYLKNNLVARTTFKYEQIRAISLGILETASTTFILLIAVRFFRFSANLKWLTISGDSLGLLFCPLLVYYVAKNRLNSSKSAAVITFLGGISILVAAFSPNPTTFICASILGICSVAIIIPLCTQMYSNNYPEESIGTLYSLTRVIRIISVIIFAYFAGNFFTGRIYLFPYLLFIYALALFLNSYCLSKCPSHPIKDDVEIKLSRGFSYLKNDLIFRNTLICWMLLGTANLITAPLRIEYLANPKYNLNFTEAQIALFISIIPNATKLVLTPIWGLLFDKISFFAIRFLANIALMIGIVGFFMSASPSGFFITAIFYGIAQSGGDVTWNLWVTKLAPQDRVSEYMAVHLFMTGIRFLIAPLIGFHLAGIMSLSSIGWLCAFLGLISNYWLLPGLKQRKKKPTF